MQQHIDALKGQRAALDEEIRNYERALADEQEKVSKQAFGVKVVCGNCRGTGIVTTGGRDIISDPPVEDSCEFCHGEGFLWARKFFQRGYYEELPWEMEMNY